MKRFFFLLLLLTMARSVPAMVVESGTSVVIDQPVYEDVYLAGGTITIDAPIHGDLVVAGGNVYINDSVTRDILVVGGTVTIKGYVGGRIRSIGGTIRITGNVQNDLVIAAGNIFLEKGSTVFGSLLATGGDLTLNGDIKGDIKVAVGSFKLYGTAGRNLDCRAGKIEIDGTIAGSSILAASDNLMISNNAAFKGEVRYWTSDKNVNFGKSLEKGNAVSDESLAIKTRSWYFLGATTLAGILLYLGMGLVSIIMLQYLFASIFKKAGDTVYLSTLKSLGSGFLFLAGMPVLIFLVFITLVGAPLGLILLFGYITVILLCSSIVSMTGANWLNNRSGNNPGSWSLIWKAFGIFILLRLILFTPFLGWFLYLLLSCIACGAILLNIKWKRLQKV